MSDDQPNAERGVAQTTQKQRPISNEAQAIHSIGIVDYIETIFKGDAANILENYDKLTRGDAARTQSDRIVIDRLTARVLFWFEVRGVFITDSVAEIIGGGLLGRTEIRMSLIETLDDDEIDMWLARAGSEVCMTLQWYLTWFVYIASDVGPLNPIMVRYDFSVDAINPVLVDVITDELAMYMRGLVQYPKAWTHQARESYSVDATINDLLTTVTVDLPTTIDLADPMGSGVARRMDQNGNVTITRTKKDKKEKKKQKVESAKVELPVFMLRCGVFTLAQRFLISGRARAACEDGSNFGKAIGELTDLFSNDASVYTLPMILRSEATAGICDKTIDSFFGYRANYCGDDEHKKPSKWHMQALPAHVAAQIMPLLTDILHTSMLDYTGVVHARKLSALRACDAVEALAENLRSTGVDVVIEEYEDSFGNKHKKIVSQHSVTPSTFESREELALAAEGIRVEPREPEQEDADDDPLLDEQRNAVVGGADLSYCDALELKYNVKLPSALSEVVVLVHRLQNDTTVDELIEVDKNALDGEMHMLVVPNFVDADEQDALVESVTDTCVELLSVIIGAFRKQKLIALASARRHQLNGLPWPTGLGTIKIGPTNVSITAISNIPCMVEAVQAEYLNIVESIEQKLLTTKRRILARAAQKALGRVDIRRVLLDGNQSDGFEALVRRRTTPSLVGSLRRIRVQDDGTKTEVKEEKRKAFSESPTLKAVTREITADNEHAPIPFHIIPPARDAAIDDEQSKKRQNTLPSIFTGDGNIDVDIAGIASTLDYLPTGQHLATMMGFVSDLANKAKEGSDTNTDKDGEDTEEAPEA
jgi:hypothetical protein